MNYIEIENFRTIRKTHFELGMVNFFIGDNNVGKSSILKLIESLFKNRKLDFSDTYLGNNVISDLKKDDGPINIFYSFSRGIKREKSENWERMFEYLEIDSIEGYNYPLITKFAVQDASRKEIACFEMQYELVKNIIRLKEIVIKEFPYYFEPGLPNKGEYINRIKNITESKEALFSERIELKGENVLNGMEETPMPFFKMLINNSNHKFRINILLDMYDWKTKLENKTVKKQFFGMTRSFEMAYGIRYIDPLRPVFKEIYNKNDIKMDKNLRFMDDLSTRNSSSKSINGFLERTNMLKKIIMNKISSEHADFYIPMYDTKYKSGLKLSISGTGISQITPILFEISSHENHKILIEQPEVHLHPRAQAELGTFLFNFLETELKGKRKQINDFEFSRQLFIETHSLYLLERLRFEIKKSSVEWNELFLRILFLNNTNQSGEVSEISILKTGKYNGNINDFLNFFIDEDLKNLG
jgi:predicted ATP-dependent endonuclease of OLD family